MRIVLLDLEETVIDDWFSRNALPANLEKIARFLRPTDRLGLMSWAVYGADDKREFQQDLQLPLEGALRHPFSEALVFSMDDFVQIIFKMSGKLLQRDDLYDLYAKEECLLKLLRLGYFCEFTEVILIDDRVDHNLQFVLRSRSVRFLNIKDTTW